jgi:hypothetical protein
LVITVSAVLLLAVGVAVLVRWAGLKAWHGVVCVLFGFYLASSGFAPDINRLVSALMHALTGGQ